MKRTARIITAMLSVLLLPLFFAAPASATSQSCTVQVGGGCGAYNWTGWPGSNGYNTYVNDQPVDFQSGGSGSLTASSPSSWTTTGNYTSCGGCVQTYNAVQQLTNNWGTGGWNCGTTCTDTPVSSLTLLQAKYNETSPTDSGDQYEFSPDIWTNYAGRLGGGSGDIMMWVDTSPQRCSAVNGWTVIGHPVLFSQNWTAYVGPGGPGDEIIMVLDGAGGSGTCAQQTSGTIHILAALNWLSAHPAKTGFPAKANLTMDQYNIGWEITDAAGGTYSMNSLSYPVKVG